jgi:TRAP-type C4-dicarboxylate transport system permease small subunit
MFKTIDKNLNKLYQLSGYTAAIFLILIAVFILIGISSRMFGFYIRGLAEYSGYCMAAASFFALAYTFVEGGHIRITLFLEKLSGLKKKLIEIWCLSIGSFFSGYLAFYFIKMLIISYKFQERSEGADEILIWIPQTSVAIGSIIFSISVFHHLILVIRKK